MPPRPIAMIADDDPATRRVVSDVLVLLGFEPELFDDGDGLAVAVLLRAPALIVTDENMVRWNGTQALGHVRTHGAICPAILLTAFPDEGLVLRALALSPCELLAKPVDVAVLSASVSRMMAWRAA